ncbi:uncharacterized protein MELLADRAFT_106409 [Melampsora larici-populina 98AG31]|uniref:Uncharacterized protein n=1 Tax=Melampsora larici-populina (strain 98AG31 / pathotype 3-4-7) TaxID=747676 RepID=F4RLA5_MELLP|nr:uncharacterized protein MELLADRAFT_106409 [Melampsora larici-populina 98AG31]EGG06905.1 hypothetical protein MELLADRAFT_106409 [Melampsora larici-populina 98AG31]
MNHEKNEVLNVIRTEFKYKFSLQSLESKINVGLDEGFARIQKQCLDALDEEFKAFKHSIPVMQAAPTPLPPPEPPVLLQISNVVLKNLFTSGLRADVKDRALKHPDWFKCSTIEERQAVALMASEQVIHVSANNASFGQSHAMQRAASSPPVVHVPRDPNAMDVDIHAVNSRRPFPPLPSGITFGFFIKFCHARTVCHRCLKAYDSTHKTPDGKSACPNPPPRSTQEIEAFMQRHQARPNATVAAFSTPNGPRDNSRDKRPPFSFQHSVLDVSAAFHHLPVQPYQLPPHLQHYQQFQFGPALAPVPAQVLPLQHPGLPAALGMPKALSVTDPVQQVSALCSAYV